MSKIAQERDDDEDAVENNGEPRIDRSPKKSEEDLIDEIALQLPNIPIQYLNDNRETNWRERLNKAVRSRFFPLLRLVFTSLYM